MIRVLIGQIIVTNRCSALIEGLWGTLRFEESRRITARIKQGFLNDPILEIWISCDGFMETKVHELRLCWLGRVITPVMQYNINVRSISILWLFNCEYHVSIMLGHLYHLSFRGKSTFEYFWGIFVQHRVPQRLNCQQLVQVAQHGGRPGGRRDFGASVRQSHPDEFKTHILSVYLLIPRMKLNGKKCKEKRQYLIG